MNYSSGFHDNQPIWWIRRMPVYYTTILIALFVVGMIVTTFLKAGGVDIWRFVFSVGGFWKRGWYWQPVTCIFLQSPNFFFLIGMFFLYTPSVEVEKYLGRTRFLTLLAIFLLTPPLALTVIWKTLGAGSLMEYFGSFHLTVGMFIAFATLYPNMEWFSWVPLKWIAFAGLALVALSCLPDKNWVDLALHFSMSAAAFGYIKFLQFGGSEAAGDFLKKISPFRRRPKFRVVPSPTTRAEKTERHSVSDSIDPLLDKIAKSGLASLTARERAQLEQAREALLRKDRP